ncbi:MAG: hypothetical protein ABI629_15880 [bacterium]
MLIRSFNRTLAALALCAAAAAFSTRLAHADVIVIDDTTAGTVIDGILDGFPFPPPGLAPDGAGDFAGNAFGVALQTGVTEERGIVELPLTPLAGLTSGDIATATLTFNIDDVVGTFGPGTSFDGTAAATIVLFKYSGNGTIDLADFGNVAGAPLAVVSTVSLGTITDSTLSVSGPLQFTVDVTGALGGLLDASATHFGLVFTTNDAGSATSLDNLGFSGAGPAGANGARMPFLTVTTVPNDPPVYTKAQLACQAAIAKGGAKLVKTAHKGLVKCLDGVLKAAATALPYTTITTKCVADLDPANPASKVGKAIAKLQAGLTGKCTGQTPGDVGQPCSPTASTFADVGTCVAAQHLAQTAAAVAAEYGTACALITAVGLDDEYPTLCAD